MEYRGLLKTPEDADGNGNVTTLYGNSLAAFSSLLLHDMRVIYTAYVARHNKIYQAMISKPDVPFERNQKIQLGELQAQLFQQLKETDIIETIISKEIENQRFLAAVTEKGNGFIWDLKSEKPSEPVNLKPSAQLTNERGWAGIDIDPLDPTKAVTARYFPRNISFYEEDKLVRSVNTQNFPCQIKYLHPEAQNSRTGLVGIVEAHEFTIWDVRVAEKNGCVSRLSPSPGGLFALDSTVGLMGVCGADRSVYVYDARSNRVMSSWNSCLKHDATQFSFLESDPTFCSVAGSVDSEISFGKLAKNGNSVGKRCDNRIIGFRRIEKSDTVVGLTGCNTIYIFDQPIKFLQDDEGRLFKKSRQDFDD